MNSFECADPKCPKCDWPKTTVKRSYNHAQFKEWLCWTCSRCDYYWHTLTKDNNYDV